MGLRIVTKETSPRKRRKKEELRRQLLDLEADRWSQQRLGDIRQLHAEFLAKVKDIRSQSTISVKSLADHLQIQIKEQKDIDIHSKKTVGSDKLLDLL